MACQAGGRARAGLQPGETLAGRLREHAARRGDRLFLYELATGRRFTFATFDPLVDATCRYLSGLGIGPGDLVTFVLDNNVECCLLYFACLRLGCVANPYPAVFSPVEVLPELDLVSPAVVLAHEDRAAALAACRRHRVVPIAPGAPGGFVEQIEPHLGPWPDVRPRGESIACLYPSAGADDEPRGIRYTHANIAALVPSIVRGFRLTAGDIHLIVLPLGHTAALNYSLFPAAWCGGTVVLAPGFWEIRDDFWRVLADFRVSYVQTVPTVLVMLQHLPGRPRGADVPPYVACGSAPLPRQVQDGFERAFGLKAANLYGLSETGPTHVDDPRSPGWVAGSIGHPLDVNEVSIFDADGHAVADGVEGEIAIRGANIFAGYQVNPVGAAGRFSSGYFRTGDAGVRAPRDGRFFFTQRLKPLIIKGGFNIHPWEIDRVLLSHPAVAAVSTIASPDDYLGDAVTSTVTLRAGAEATAASLRQFCCERLSLIKVPDVIRLAGRS